MLYFFRPISYWCLLKEIFPQARVRYCNLYLYMFTILPDYILRPLSMYHQLLFRQKFISSQLLFSLDLYFTNIYTVSKNTTGPLKEALVLTWHSVKMRSAAMLYSDLLIRVALTHKLRY